MIVWRIVGDEIGPDGNGAAHFTKKADARKAIYEYAKWRKSQGRDCGHFIKPEQVSVSNREELAAALDAAMGYGAT